MCTITVDLSSAFDTLNHNVLIIIIIKELGIEVSPLRWLISFFTDRTSSVKVNDFISPPNNISSGIPHGSVLGPLFSIYLLHIRKYCSTRITRKLINVFVLSRIDCRRSIFSDTNSTDIKKVDRIIRASIRRIYNVNHHDHMLTDMYQHNLK